MQGSAYMCGAPKRDILYSVLQKSTFLMILASWYLCGMMWDDDMPVLHEHAVHYF
jgi:hypothetical protein